MNKYIEQQLYKAKYVSIPQFDSDTTHLIIKRSTAEAVSSQQTAERATIALTEYMPESTASQYEISKCYKIVIDKTLIKDEPLSKWYQTIHNCWNGGNGPTDQIMLVQALEFNTSKKMMRVRGKGIMSNTIWAGWLPVSNLKLLEEVPL